MRPRNTLVFGGRVKKPSVMNEVSPSLISSVATPKNVTLTCAPEADSPALSSHKPA